MLASPIAQFASRSTNTLLTPFQPSDQFSIPNIAQALKTPVKDDYAKKLEEEKLSARRFPDWYVMTTLAQSFQPLSQNGIITIPTLTLLRNQFYKDQFYREARVVHHLIQYKKVLQGIGAPWEKPKFKSLPGYSWADVQFLLEKVKAGQDVDDIVASHYDHKSREAMYFANWAEMINVPLTLMVGLLSLGVLGKVNMLGKPVKKATEVARSLVK